MIFETEDKGKIFTNIISKHPVEVLIQTADGLVRGNIHVRRDERLKDEIDRDEPTLAVTDAVVYSQSGETIYRTKFMALNRHHIIWIIPVDELGEMKSE
jgi:hypothetical protein